MKGTTRMELRDVKRIDDPDEAVGAIIRLAEVVETIEDRVSEIEEYHKQEQIRFRELVDSLEGNKRKREGGHDEKGV